eukprot:CAMPEP_0203753480 /NCGR_PEP_ID=MMETSP0098-20131031/7235_1 /ASSEMBLY_ACC=CAM_ASM_000208 /TAXON_ID=96639 /ORGANISM=" , Strain NY0313808BC1" /LENGTH=1418 /DNA_ID=CAMNT_0050644095 /DNA_START=2625 /DNA_END=6878 /DNA_ORIENTATION=-
MKGKESAVVTDQAEPEKKEDLVSGATKVATKNRRKKKTDVQILDELSENVITRISRRQSLINHMEIELRRVHKLGCPKTVVGLVESLWRKDDIGIDEEDIRVENPKRIFLFPNGKELYGEFHGTWSQLLKSLDELEHTLRCMIPPKQGSWKLPIPPFQKPINGRPIKIKLVEPKLDTIPKFVFSGRGLMEVPNKPERPVLLVFKTVSMKRLDLPEIDDMPLPTKRLGEIKKSTNRNEKCEFNPEQHARKQVDLIFGKKFKSRQYSKWELYDFAVLLRDVAPKVPHSIRYVPPKLLAKLEDSHVNKREPRLDDFLVDLQPEPTWSEDRSRNLMLNSQDIATIHSAWGKRIRKNTTTQSVSPLPFKQIENLPGIHRERFPMELGHTVFSPGQQYSFVELQTDLGEAPLIDFVRIGNSVENACDLDQIEVHDVTSNGFILRLQHNSSSAIAATSCFSLTENDTDAPVIKVWWRALHESWGLCGAVACNEASQWEWHPRQALGSGFILDYPMKPLLIPPMWDSEQNQREIDYLVQKAELSQVEPYCPPVYPKEREAEVVQRYSQHVESIRYCDYKATILVDCSSSMLDNSVWQRTKYMLRCFLNPDMDHAKAVFGNRGMLHLVATSGKTFNLETFDEPSLAAAQRWVASLDTICSTEVVFLPVPEDIPVVHILSNNADFLQDANHRFRAKQTHLVLLTANGRTHSNDGNYVLVDFSSLEIDYENDFPFLCLDDAVVDKSFPSNAELARIELEKIGNDWKDQVEAYNKVYAEREEEIRKSNRARLDEAKREHVSRQKQRTEFCKSAREAAEHEKVNRALWRWQNLAALCEKRDRLTALNMFLAVASNRKISRHRKKTQQAAAERAIAQSCALEAMTLVMERVMIDASRKQWMEHTARVRDIRLQNAAVTQRAKELMEKTKQTSSGKFVKNTQLAEHNECLLMAAEEEYQRRILKFTRRMGVNPALKVICRAARAKARVMHQLLSGYFGIVSGESSLDVPQNPKHVLENFLPLKSHQARCLGWKQEMFDKQDLQRTEAHLWKVRRHEMLEKLVTVRAKFVEEEKQEELEKCDTARSEYSDQMSVVQSEFDNRLSLFEHDVQSLVSSLEVNDIITRGWRLMLLPAPFTKSFRTFQSAVVNSHLMISLLDFMTRIEKEYEDGVRDEALISDLEDFPVDNVFLSGIKFDDSVNMELLRTIRARIGAGGLPGGKTRKGNKHRKNLKQRTNSLVSKPWSSFLLSEKLHASNVRKRQRMLEWFVVVTGHLEAENHARNMLARFRFNVAIQKVKRHNSQLVAEEEAEFEAKVANRIREQNRKKQLLAKEQYEEMVNSLTLETRRKLESAQERYQSEVVTPLETFNSAIEHHCTKAKAAKAELKLLTHFKEQLVIHRKQSKGKSKSIVPVQILRSSLTAAFATRNQVAGSGA